MGAAIFCAAGHGICQGTLDLVQRTIAFERSKCYVQVANLSAELAWMTHRSPMRGSAVLRSPGEYLDDALQDLRHAHASNPDNRGITSLVAHYAGIIGIYYGNVEHYKRLIVQAR